MSKKLLNKMLEMETGKMAVQYVTVQNRTAYIQLNGIYFNSYSREVREHIVDYIDKLLNVKRSGVYDRVSISW